MDKLFTELKAGKKSAIKQLYEKEYHHCKWAVLNSGGTDNDAKEVFQEALFSLLDKIKKENFDVKYSLKQYLYKTCQYIWYSAQRKKNKTNLVNEFADKMDGADFSLGTDSSDIYWVALYKGLNKLGKDCQKLLDMTFFEKLSDKEIAPVAGYELNYVRLKRKRCMDQLRKQANLIMKLLNG